MKANKETYQLMCNHMVQPAGAWEGIGQGHHMVQPTGAWVVLRQGHHMVQPAGAWVGFVMLK